MKNFLYLSMIFCCACFCACGTSRKAFDPDRKYSPAQLKKDYTLFRDILEDMHPSLYWYMSKDSMDYYFNQGLAGITDSMTEPQFRTRLSFVISRIGSGHTSGRSSRDYSHYLDTVKGHQFPLVLKFWNDTMVVAVNLNRRDSILRRGVLLDSIDGRSTRQLVDTLFNYFVTDGYNQTGKYQYLSTGLNFGSWYKNVYGYSKNFRIAYRDSAGIMRETTIPLYDQRADTVRWFGLRSRGGGRAPEKRGSRRKRELFLTRNLQLDSSGGTAYMMLNTFENGNHLGRFFRQSFKSLDEHHIQNLVIDVRSNGGGDATNSTHLTRYLIDHPFKVADSLYAIRRHGKYSKYIEKDLLYRLMMTFVSSKRADGKYHFGYFERHVFNPLQKHHFGGQIYVLTGGNSFSATSLFAGALKGQKNVTLVGEETGGGYYGNTAWMIPDVTLPETGVRFRLPRFRLVVDRAREKNGHGVEPDVIATPSIEAITRGLDFKTAKARELIHMHAAAKK
jgi:hypothetical protein